MLARWREAISATAPVAVFATLVCCALPIALVAVGAGSVVAAAVSTAPWIAIFSRYKALVFAVALTMLIADYWILYRSQATVCKPGGVCHRTHPVGRLLRYAFWGSAALFVVALAAAYLALPVARAFGY